jgi:hypothetical protein
MKVSDFIHRMKQYDDLPLLTRAPAPMTDSDVEFHSDLQYMRLLLDDMWESAYYSGRKVRVDPAFIDYMATMAAAMNATNKAITAANDVVSLFLRDWREQIENSKAVTAA